MMRLQIFNEYHFDGVERALFKHEITQTDIDNGFIDTDSWFDWTQRLSTARKWLKIVSVTTKAFSLMRVVQAQTCLVFDIKWH